VNITVKAIPDDLGAALKRAAEQSHRSLNGEIIHRLSMSLAENARVPESRIAESPDAVADAWEALAGRWRSDLSVETEIAALYEGRSAGRDMDISW
jgi:plasmid stability protein